MSLLRRSLKVVAVVLGLLVGLLAVAATSAFAYGHTESSRTTPFPGGSPKPFMYLGSETPASGCDRECEVGDSQTREIFERSEEAVNADETPAARSRGELLTRL